MMASAARPRQQLHRGRTTGQMRSARKASRQFAGTWRAATSGGSHRRRYKEVKAEAERGEEASAGGVRRRKAGHELAGAGRAASSDRSHRR
jgi:hypothetical protein